MIESWELTIPELSGREPRRAYVYIPHIAKKQPKRRFPVLYMFDGHNVFFDEDATYGKSWGLGEYLDYTDTPLIVAAVECSHGENFARLSEYSPFPISAPGYGELPGRGKETMEWFIRRFKPYIDAHYPTLPDREHTFIAGSSMGGLMSLYAAAAYNRVFSRAAALSPALDFNASDLNRLLKEADMAPDTVIYMDYGENEFKHDRRAAPRFRSTASVLLRRGVRLTARIVPEGEHCEASWEKQIPFFIPTLLYNKED